MSFLLDSNIFIETATRLPIDLYPSFWQALYQLAQDGRVVSCIKVKEEIYRGNEDDPLISWCNTLPEGFFVPIDESVISKYGETIRWAYSRNFYRPEALNEFSRSDIADAYLVATAAAKQYTLVTHETSDLNCKRRVKIPDAANSVGVRTCVLNDMLRNLGVRI